MLDNNSAVTSHINIIRSVYIQNCRSFFIEEGLELFIIKPLIIEIATTINAILHLAN